jgi:hypothetical protein
LHFILHFILYTSPLALSHILFIRNSGAKLVFSRKWSIIIGISHAIYVVVLKGADILIYSSAINRVLRVSSIFYKVIKALTT